MISLFTLTLFDILMLGFMYSLWPGITNRKIRHPELVFTNKVSIIWIICIIFCVYAGWDTDYQHYFSIYRKIYENRLSILVSHLENIYSVFITFSFGNYSLFRFYIWGSAVLLLIISLKKLDLNNNITAITFVSFNLLYFSYARVSLAIMIYVYGLILLRQQNSSFKLLRILLGAVLILISVFFHKSLAFMIILTPLAFIRLSKDKILFGVLLLPILIIIMQYAKDIILSDASGGENGELAKMGSAASQYTTRTSTSSGPVGMLISFIETIAFIYGVIICWMRRKVLDSSKIVRGLWNITLGLIVISILSDFMGLGYVISRRIVLLGYVSVFFVLAYIFTNRFRKKEFVTFCLLSMSYSAIKIVYYLYVNKVYGF